MSLNDEVFEELGNDIQAETVPDLGMGKPEEANVIRTTGRPLDETPKVPALMDKILDPATKFKAVVKGVTQVSTMEDLLARIDVKNAISFADAEEVSMMFENFQTQFPLNGFTSRPSLTWLKETKSFLRKGIRARQESIGSELENLLTGPSEDQQEAFRDYRETYGELLKRDLRDFRIEVKAFEADERKLNGQTLEGHGGVVDLLADPLDQIGSDLPVLCDHPLTMKALENLQSLLKDNMHFRPFFVVAASDGDFEQFMDDHFVQSSASEKITLGFLMSTFSSGRVEKFLAYLEEGADKAVLKLQEIEKQAKVDPSDFKQVRDFVVNNTEAIDEATGWIHYYVELSELVRDTHLNMTVVLEFMKI